jgi:hypothetical protein
MSQSEILLRQLVQSSLENGYWWDNFFSEDTCLKQVSMESCDEHPSCFTADSLPVLLQEEIRSAMILLHCLSHSKFSCLGAIGTFDSSSITQSGPLISFCVAFCGHERNLQDEFMDFLISLLKRAKVPLSVLLTKTTSLGIPSKNNQFYTKCVQKAARIT